MSNFNVVFLNNMALTIDLQVTNFDRIAVTFLKRGMISWMYDMVEYSREGNEGEISGSLKCFEII